MLSWKSEIKDTLYMWHYPRNNSSSFSALVGKTTKKSPLKSCKSMNICKNMSICVINPIKGVATKKKSIR